MTTEQHIKAPALFNADFCLTCKGNSMINARIADGDIIYIRQQNTVENGDVAAVLINDEAVIGRLWFSNGFTVLEPANPSCRSTVFREGEKVPIIGKVIAFTSIIAS